MTTTTFAEWRIAPYERNFSGENACYTRARTGVSHRLLEGLEALKALHTAFSRANLGRTRIFRMIAQRQFEQLQDAIFAVHSHAVYAVLDGSQVENLPQQLADLESACLFSPPLDPMLDAAAPRLVKLSPGCPGTELALRQGWNIHWGIILVTDGDVDLDALRSHLRRNLRVRSPNGRPLLFRFFDPRAFRSVIPTMDAAQRREFFGPILGAYVEGETADCLLHFSPDKTEPNVLPLAAAS